VEKKGGRNWKRDFLFAHSRTVEKKKKKKRGERGLLVLPFPLTPANRRGRGKRKGGEKREPHHLPPFSIFLIRLLRF